MESILKEITFFEILIWIIFISFISIYSIAIYKEGDQLKQLITQAEYIHLELKRFNDQIDPDVIRMRATKRRKEQKCID